MEENHTEKDNKNESRSEEIEVTIETQTNLEITEVGLENTEIIPEKQIEIDPNKKT
jgi:hypothetical protein